MTDANTTETMPEQMISDPATSFYVFRDGVKSNKPVSYAEALDFLNECEITDADRVEIILENGLPFEIDSGQMWFERIEPIAVETGKPSASGVSAVRDQTVSVVRDRPVSAKEFEITDMKAHVSAIRRSTIETLVLSGLLASVLVNLVAWHTFRVNHHETTFAAFISFLGFKL